MRPFRQARRATLVTATLCVAALVTTSGGAVAKADPSQQSRDFRKAVTVRGVAQHLDALQAVADANNGNRASGTPGYAASRDYVVQKLRAAGYRPTVQTFQFDYYRENAPAQLAQLTPDATTYVAPTDITTMEFSASGPASGTVVAVDTAFTAINDSTSGCEAADFAGFPSGAIALMQRGTCDFSVKVANAATAGASAALIFNRGTNDSDGDNRGPVQGTLGTPARIPAVGVSFAVGVDLGSPAGATARVVTDTVSEGRPTYNVIAETRKGDPDNVVMSGAHLDSVEAGPGINDNASGSAALLEIAEEMAEFEKVKKVENKVRFAWWGAEESGLLGATHYVDDLKATNPDALGDIALYLNYDMVGSPNFVRFVYDGDNTLETPGVTAPEGSAQIERLFTRYFRSQRLPTEPTAFDGRSDYGPFIANGVPAGGLFTGAEGVKTAAQAAKYGGTAGVAYDACYHEACDTRANISMTGLDQMVDAAAHATYVLSRSTKAVNGNGSGNKSHKLGPSNGHRANRLAARHEYAPAS
jgi:Zn-dependent M28 family amino/carboxypeptidase